MKVRREPGPLDMFGGTVEFETTSFDAGGERKLYKNGPSKLMFNAGRLEDVVFRIGGKEYTIDFPALVRDYGKEVEHG